MISVPDEDFERILGEAIDGIPTPYSDHIENVVFILEDQPTPQQRQQLRLYPNETLYGLYEGVPLPQRGGSLKVLPDKITIFKQPLLASSFDLADLKKNIGHTVWHEVAHYFGLDHQRIHELEDRQKT